MRIKISFSSIDSVSSPIEWMYGLEEAGFQGWEIIDEGSQHVEGGFKERIKEIYETTNLTLSLHAPLSDLNIASINERIWEESIRQVRESMGRVYEFIDDICVVHPGNFSPLSIQIPEKAKEKEISGIRRLCKYASEYGLQIAVENMPSVEMVLGRKKEELTQIINEVNMDNLGICLDIGHAITTKTLNDFLDTKAEMRLSLNIIHLHASDNFGEKDEHLPLGKGNIEWNKVFEWEWLKGYKGIMVTEMKRIEDGIESLKFIKSHLPL